MLRLLLLLIAVAAVALVLAVRSDAHLVATPKDSSVVAIHNAQSANLYHARYVCRYGDGQHRRWACKAATGWLLREWQQTRPADVIYRMIQAAEQVAREGVGDPWPNCLDPYDGSGASWQRTKNCESPGYAWSADPPGYDCGPLQLDPILWRHVIRRWGVPC